jgi:hypothetical protein
LKVGLRPHIVQKWGHEDVECLEYTWILAMMMVWVCGFVMMCSPQYSFTCMVPSCSCWQSAWLAALCQACSAPGFVSSSRQQLGSHVRREEHRFYNSGGPGWVCFKVCAGLQLRCQSCSSNSIMQQRLVV